MPVPWSGGPPTKGELENWLVTVKGLEREQARRLAVAYTQTRGGWTAETLDEWVNEMVPTVADPEDPASSISDSAGQMVAERDAMDEARGTRNQALAEQRSSVVRNQVQSYYDRAQVITDSGAGFDQAALANSLAIGAQTDASGNFILDENGQPMGVSPQEVWQQIKGLRFNMGNLSMPYPAHRSTGPIGQRREGSFAAHSTIRGIEGPVEAQRAAKRSADADAARWSRNPNARFRGNTKIGGQKRVISPSEALALLGAMDEDYLTRLQQEMFDAGLYGENAPSWGVADTVTRQAFVNMFTEAAQRDPGKPINRILDEMAAERIARGGPPESGPGSPAEQQLVEIPDFSPSVTSRETLSQTIDDIAQDLFGEFVPKDRREALIAKLQEKEIGIQRTEYDRSVANIREQAQAQYALGGEGGAGGGEIDRFMQAISGQESGGDYNVTNPDSGAYGRFQIMPSNWAPWATRAGLGPNAPRTAQNQDIVARRIMLDYYQQFGNWRDVAVAWYAGPGRVAQVRNSTRAQGRYPSIARYADQIMDRMGRITQGDPMAQSGIVEVGGENLPPIETFDPAAEAQAILKAQDPVGWEAHEFADRATEFFSLLGGVA